MADDGHKGVPFGGARGSASTLLLLALFFALPAQAQMPGPVRPGAMPPDDAMHQGVMMGHGGAPKVEEIGVIPARVQVLRLTEDREDADFAPEQRIEVKLQWRQRPGETVVREVRAMSDAGGWATFDEVPLLANENGVFVLVAEVLEGASVQRSEPLKVSAKEAVGELRLMQVKAAPERVKIRRVDTVIQIPTSLAEHPGIFGHVEVQQLYELVSDGWLIYDTGVAKRAAHSQGILIPVPEGSVAQEGKVLAGSEGAVQPTAEGGLAFRGVVRPEALGPTHVVVQYFVEAEGSSLEFGIPVLKEWGAAEVVVICTTEIPSLGDVDMELEVEGFAGAESRREDPRWPGRRVLVSTGSSQPAGGVVKIRLRNLPYPDDPVPLWVGLGALLILILGFVLAFLGRKKASPKVAPEVLRSAYQELIQAIVKLDEAGEAGAGVATARERLKIRAATLLRALDEA